MNQGKGQLLAEVRAFYEFRKTYLLLTAFGVATLCLNVRKCTFFIQIFIQFTGNQRNNISGMEPDVTLKGKRVN